MLILTAAMATAQKYAFVDTEYIRRNIPAFETAQQQLDKLSEQWEKEIADGYTAIEQMYKSYQNEAPLLSQDMKIQREEAIINREKEIKELQTDISEWKANSLRKGKNWLSRSRMKYLRQ